MWIAPGFLEAHWRAHDVSGFGATVVMGKMQPWEGNAPTLANRFYDRRLTRIDQEMSQLESDLPCNYLCTGNISMPRALFEGGARFDEGFAGYSFEDTELGYHLAERGVTFRYAPQALAYHRTTTSVADHLRKQQEAGGTAVHLVRCRPQAAGKLDTPYEVPGVPETRRCDGAAKRVAKSLFFWPPTGAVLEALLRMCDATRWHAPGFRLLYLAGYHRYGRAYRAAVAKLGAPEPVPSEVEG
jgi:hypothetical protein